eukprot:TRINITY_DN19176_c0_g1_i1.p1 TRINITY_DN19176_c0_g1~~TRINITY_DN19176_c0_g1_i1.p1  ORF type:complete len:522 (+),score=54.93 TRINITY_DN19176_c0_g1_i1:41-1606(+)
MLRRPIFRLGAQKATRWQSINADALDEGEMILTSDPSDIPKSTWKLDRAKDLAQRSKNITRPGDIMDMDAAAGLSSIKTESVISEDEGNLELGDKPTKFIILRKSSEKHRLDVINGNEINMKFSQVPTGYGDTTIAIRASNGRTILGYGLWQARLKKCFVFIWLRGGRSSLTVHNNPSDHELLIPGRKFWFSRFFRALEFRQTFIDFEKTDCFRLINGSADGCPGLVVDLLRTVAHIKVNEQVAVAYIPYLVEYLQTRTPCTEIFCSSKSKGIVLPRAYRGQIGGGNLSSLTVTENGLLFKAVFNSAQHCIKISHRSWREAIEKYSHGRDCCVIGDASGMSASYALRGEAKKVLVVNQEDSVRKMTEFNINLSFHKEEVRATHQRANQGFAYHFPNIEKQHAYSLSTLSGFFQKLQDFPYDFFAIELTVDLNAQSHTAIATIVNAIRKIRVDPDMGNTGIVMISGFYDLHELRRLVSTAAASVPRMVRVLEQISPHADTEKSLGSIARPSFSGMVLSVRSL